MHRYDTKSGGVVLEGGISLLDGGHCADCKLGNEIGFEGARSWFPEGPIRNLNLTRSVKLQSVMRPLNFNHRINICV